MYSSCMVAGDWTLLTLQLHSLTTTVVQSIGTLYSAAAIIVQIPAADKRCTGS